MVVKYLRFYGLFFIGFICFLSCRVDEKIDEKPKIYDFVLRDSLVVDYSNMELISFNKKQFLLFNRISNSIAIHNINTSKTNSFNILGGGPKEIKNINSVFFANDSLIGVCEAFTSNVKLYSLVGEFIKQIKMPSGTLGEDDLTYSDDFTSLNDSLILYQNRPTGEYIDQNPILEHDCLYILDFKNDSLISSFLNFPPKNSVYNDKEFFYDNSLLTYALNVPSSALSVLFLNNPEIYTYDLKQLKLQKQITLSPKKYKPKKYKYTKNHTNEDYIFGYFEGSQFEDIYYSDKYTLVTYNEGISKKEVQTYQKNNNSFPRKKDYIAVIDNTNNQINYDFLLDETMGELQYVSKKGLLYFKTSREIDDLNSRTTFLIYDIQKK